MKKSVNIAIILLLSIGLFSSAPIKNKKAAIIKFKTEVIDFGTINQNAEGKRSFTFTNTGNIPLTISKVKTSCGCTVANYTKKPILPGEDGEISIIYNTKILGKFTKSITVISNAQQNYKTLKIKGNIVKQL